MPASHSLSTVLLATLESHHRWRALLWDLLQELAGLLWALARVGHSRRAGIAALLRVSCLPQAARGCVPFRVH